MQHWEAKTAEYSHNYSNRSPIMADLLIKLHPTNRGDRTVNKTAASAMKQIPY